MKTAKVGNVLKVYALECPHCGGDVANDENGSLDFYDNETHGATGTCTVCGKVVKLPKALRSEVVRPGFSDSEIERFETTREEPEA